MTMKSKPQHVARTAKNVAQDPRWAAVIARDPAADDKFVYAVKTTGIYCKPSSASRLPKPENVEFFDTAKAAIAAGYRPSTATNQTTVAVEHANLVAEVCRKIEAAEAAPSLEALAKSARMSPFHFHRVFKEVTGLTPKAYASAHRARRMRERLTGPIRRSPMRSTTRVSTPIAAFMRLRTGCSACAPRTTAPVARTR